VGQNVIREVGGELRHAPGVAGGADAPALAGEGDQSLVATVLAAGPGEPVGEDAAAQVGSEVLLDPPWNTVAQGIDLRGPGKEGLQVVLNDRVQGGRGWTSRPIGGRGGRVRWPRR